MTDMMMEDDGVNDPFKFMSIWPKMWKEMISIVKDLKVEYKYFIDHLLEKNITVDLILHTVQFGFLSVEFYQEFKAPIIGLSPSGPVMHASKHLGNPENPSYQPITTAPFVEPMTFSERVVNTFLYTITDMNLFIRFWKVLFNSFEEIVDIEAYRELIQNGVKMLFISSNLVTHSAQPLSPNVIEIGGINCRDGKALPKDLQEYMDLSIEGVVYVSFGSTVNPSKMSPERKQMFLEVFRQLKYPVIWKWDEEEDSIPDLPANVRLSKWLPQQDLLAHPNLRVFVTHGGLNSIQEALYHKTPIVGIALGNDQTPNVLRAEKRGYAVKLDWSSLTSEDLLSAIQKAMTDKIMLNSMEKMHKLFKDQKETPLERAVWWAEYVMRHNGADHLKPASVSLTWYQYHLLDVILFFTTIFLLIILVIMFTCRTCLRCCRLAFKEKTD